MFVFSFKLARCNSRVGLEGGVQGQFKSRMKLLIIHSSVEKVLCAPLFSQTQALFLDLVFSLQTSCNFLSTYCSRSSSIEFQPTASLGLHIQLDQSKVVTLT